jgi:serine/threonine protein phosphatase PrpC
MSDEEKKDAPGGQQPGAPASDRSTTSDPAKRASAPAPGPNVHQAKNRTLMLSRDEMEKQSGVAAEKPMAKPGEAAPGRADASARADAAARADDRVLASAVEKPQGATTAQAIPAVDSTGSVRVRYFGRTDVGLVREHNEDNFIVADLEQRIRGVEPEKPREVAAKGLGTLLAVCDGMGGAAAGEVASQMAVDTLYETLTSWEATTDRDLFARRLVRSVEEAGHRIFSAAKIDRSRRGMGTTATVAGLMDKVLFVGQVGDSRAYLKRGDSVVLITKDQSLVNQLIEAGQLTEQEAEDFEHSNIILQALGTTEEVQVDLTFLELRKGDRLMLCSDGLSGLVHPELIGDVLKNTPSLTECTKKLIDMANAGGGHDNITIIVADFDGVGLTAPSADTPAMYQQYPLPPSEGDETMPPRPAKSKVAAPKLDDATPPSVSAILAQGARGAAEGPRRLGGPLVAVFMLLSIGAIVGGLVVLKVQRGQYIPAPIRGLLDLDLDRVAVSVETNIEGELFVDGAKSLDLTGAGTVSVKVPVGLRRFEARSGGMVVAAAETLITKGQPNLVTLNLKEAPAVVDGGALADGGTAAVVTPTAAPSQAAAPGAEGAPATPEPAKALVVPVPAAPKPSQAAPVEPKPAPKPAAVVPAPAPPTTPAPPALPKVVPPPAPTPAP